MSRRYWLRYHLESREPMRITSFMATRKRFDGLAVLLALVLLFQAGMPLQSHTVLAHDGHGLVVVVCTLYGPVVSAIGMPQEPDPVPAERKSPACVFSQLLASAAFSVPTLLLTPTLSVIAGVDSRVESIRTAHVVHPYLIRAPPTGSLFT